MDKVLTKNCLINETKYRFWKFSVVGIGPVGHCYCATFAEAIRFVRLTWKRPWVVIPNGFEL